MRELIRNIGVDTSAMVALVNSNDPCHKSCLDALSEISPLAEYFTTEACLTETDYLLASDTRLRKQLEQFILLLNVQIVPLNRAGLLRVYQLMDKYSDLPMDFADASLVVACEGANARNVLTLDRRDFSVYRPNHCPRFKLLPPP